MVRSLVVALASGMVVVASCTPKEPVDLGGPCSGSETLACAVGKGALCRDGTWREWASCTGPKACYRFGIRTGTATNCDGARARAGDPCPLPYATMTRCTPDGLTRLECTDGTWRLHSACAGGCGEERRGKHLYLTCRSAPGAAPTEVEIE